MEGQRDNWTDNFAPQQEPRPLLHRDHSVPPGVVVVWLGIG